MSVKTPEHSQIATNHQAVYTLEPLRTEGPGALENHHIPGVARITLKELEISWDDCFCQTTIQKADDLFQSANSCSPGVDPIPRTGRLARAVFYLHLWHSHQPKTLEIRPPSTATMAQEPVTGPFLIWLDSAGFRHWLDEACFRVATTAARSLIISAIVLACWSAAETQGDDDDEQHRTYATA